MKFKLKFNRVAMRVHEAVEWKKITAKRRLNNSEFKQLRVIFHILKYQIVENFLPSENTLILALRRSQQGL